MKKLFTLLFLLLLLYGCHIDKGVVVNKRHRASGMVLISVWTGKSTMLMPIHQPEEYYLTIEDDGLRREFCVKPETFEKYEIGDSILNIHKELF